MGGRLVVYHVDCIEANWNTRKVKNILAQDRGFRRRMEGEKEASRELELRAQMYRFVIGSVLDDTLGNNAPSGRDRLAPVRPTMSVGELETPMSALGVDGVSEAVIRDATRGTSAE